MYIIAQFAGAVLATLLLWALLGKQGSAGPLHSAQDGL
jgi:aquaporin Z